MCGGDECLRDVRPQSRYPAAQRTLRLHSRIRAGRKQPHRDDEPDDRRTHDSPLIVGDQVRHADRREDGIIVQRVAAWTPNELTTYAPDAGMVQVNWDGERQPHWEYYAELIRA